MTTNHVVLLDCVQRGGPSQLPQHRQVLLNARIEQPEAQQLLAVAQLVRCQTAAGQQFGVSGATHGQHIGGAGAVFEQALRQMADVSAVSVGQLEQRLVCVARHVHQRLGAHFQLANMPIGVVRRTGVWAMAEARRLGQQLDGKVLKVDFVGLEQEQRESRETFISFFLGICATILLTVPSCCCSSCCRHVELDL